MTKYIKYHKNYTEFGEPYQLVLPLNLEGLVPNDDSVRLLSHELEDLNYSLLYQAYSAKSRNPAVDPKTMFKILTYAYSQNIYSSRKIETTCKRDINFMWLLAGQKAPDHSTIARFRTGFLADACEDLFYQMVRRLEQMNELSKETRTHDIQKICCFIEQVCEEQHTVFVHGRGKRKSRNQKYLELFRRFLERQTVYDWHTASFQGRNNYCKTDPDATFMHMKDDHMRNAQLKPGYNVQIGVDSEYIVAADIFQDRNDVWTLIPFLETIEKKVGFRYPSVTADSGYESEEAYTYLREQKQKPYIKPQTYEKWKKRSFKQDISKRENMGYDEITDTYICHAGKELKPLFIKKQKSKSGYESEVTVYECEDCTSCPHKERCTRAKGNKRLYISKSFLEKRQESYENILSEKGILYRMNHSIQVEGAFGVLKNDYEFQRFLLRGKTNVKLEILLLCMGYNLNKLHAKIQNERTGSHLFPVKETA